MINQKISVRQLFAMYALAVLPSAMRLFPGFGAEYGGRAGWIAPLIGILPMLALAAVFSHMFRQKENAPGGLYDAYSTAFGSFSGILIAVLSVLWLGLLYITAIRGYAERLTATVYDTGDIRFFIGVMMVLVFVAARGRLEPFARFAEFIFLIFAVVFALLILMLIPSFKPENALPVTRLDAGGVLRASYPALAVYSILPFFFFLGERTADKENALKRGRVIILALGAALTAAIMLLFGSLGHRAVTRMPEPFFNAAKAVYVTQPFDRLEALLLVVWVVSDFLLVSSLAIIIANLLKRLTNAPDARYFAAPLALLGYAGGTYFASDRFELDAFYGSTAVHSVSVAAGFALPLLALGAGTLRKKWR